MGANTMGSKCTPGPWKITGPFPEDHRCDLLHIKCSRGEDDVAIVGYDRTDPDNKAQGEADARLIAAAPDLYAELAAVKEWMEDCLIDRQQKGTPSRVRYDAICAALARVDQP